MDSPTAEGAVGSGAMWHEQQSRSRASMTQTSETASSWRHMDSHLTGRAVLSLSGRLRLTFLHTYLYECLENRLNVSKTCCAIHSRITKILLRFTFHCRFWPPKGNKTQKENRLKLSLPDSFIKSIYHFQQIEQNFEYCHLFRPIILNDSPSHIEHTGSQYFIWC